MAQQTCHLALSPSISAKFYIALRCFKPLFMVKVICVKAQSKIGRLHYAQGSTLTDVGFSTLQQAILILQQNLQNCRLKQSAFKADSYKERSLAAASASPEFCALEERSLFSGLKKVAI